MSDFGVITNPIAVREYRREWCGQTILKNEKHKKFVGRQQGEWQSWRMHLECDSAANAEPYMDDGFTPFENERPTKVSEISNGTI